MIKKTSADPFSQQAGIVQERVDWPFKSMEVGEVLEVSGDDMHDKWLPLQRYSHKYGLCCGKKFRTAKVDGKGYIKRIA